MEKEFVHSYNFFMEAPVAVCVLEGPSHIYRLANPRYVELFSLTEENIIRKCIIDVLPEAMTKGLRGLH